MLKIPQKKAVPKGAQRVVTALLPWPSLLNSFTYCFSVLPCRFLVSRVNQCNWEHLASLPGAFKSL